jgi:2-oxoglutarate dehydrogenase E2 component (dihydrolipoamide succinyltransferase)
LTKNEDIPENAGQTVAISRFADSSNPDAGQSQPAESSSLEVARLTDVVPGNGSHVHKGGGRFYSPLVLSIASSEGVSMLELEQIQGSGAEGRVTKKDILAYVAQRTDGKSAISASSQRPGPIPAAALSQQEAVPALSDQTEPLAKSVPASAPVASVAASSGADTEIIEMDRMRRMIAENMVASKRISAHVTSFVEADVTRIVQWRDKIKKSFEERFGEKLTFTPLFIEAAVRAIQDFPLINVSVDGHHLIRKKHINIGMAAALPNGNLIVPVIHHADQYNLAGLAKKVNDLANRARLGKLKPEEIQGATYTLSNVGSFGNVMGTPIIPQPQVAIMALGAIRKKPAVIETETGDLIGIRQMMFLSHSYDHRVVDGALGGMFVRRMADYLENWDTDREV